MQEMNINLKKNILLWGFILLLSAIACARPNGKICRKRNGKFPMPGSSCKGYYECENYVPAEKTCPDGEHFNANKGVCDWEDLYPCLEKLRDKECLKENGLFLKPGTNCKKYYRCCNGRAKLEACSGDSLFDPSRGNCEWPDLYTCIESLSTTKKVSSTVKIFETSTPTPEASTDPAISKSTLQKTTSNNRITYSTQDPGFERTNSRILDTSTKVNTQPTPTNGQSTIQTSETTTVTQTITGKISTSVPTAEISTTLKPREISTTEISTPQSTITEISTLQPTTTEISTSEPTSDISASQSTMTEISTLKPTTSEISIISQMTSPQMSSTHSTDHTILKENKEFDVTEPTIFETTTEEMFSPSTVEVTSSELNIMCPEPNGYFPHPTDKHKFVGCVDNIPHVLTCPSDLVYKHHLKRCDHE